MKTGQQRRGREVYMTFKDLKEKFGPNARQIRDNKYEAEAKRAPTDVSPPYWKPHPELQNDKD